MNLHSVHRYLLRSNLVPGGEEDTGDTEPHKIEPSWSFHFSGFMPLNCYRIWFMLPYDTDLVCIICVHVLHPLWNCELIYCAWSICHRVGHMAGAHQSVGGLNWVPPQGWAQSWCPTLIDIRHFDSRRSFSAIENALCGYQSRAKEAKYKCVFPKYP